MGPSGRGYVRCAKLDASLATASYVTYLGGRGSETGEAIAVNTFAVYAVVGGPLLAARENRPTLPCEPPTTVAAVDPGTGRVTAALGLAGISNLPPAASISLAADGSLLVAGRAAANPLAATADALSSTGSGFLARLDFRASDQAEVYCALSAASLTPQAAGGLDNRTVAPGTIISVFGAKLGPAEPVVAAPNGNGAYPRSIDGTTISVGDVDLPLLYLDSRQANAIVPYSLPATGALTPLRVSTATGRFKSSVWMHPALPGIFTLDASGRGQAAAINQDGTLNSVANPAPRGSIVAIYGTGLGALPLPDNALTPLTPPWPPLSWPLDVYIGAPVSTGAAGMEVLYAGPAPGLAPGVFQINVRIPEIARVGEAAIRIVLGAPIALSQDQVFISVAP